MSHMNAKPVKGTLAKERARKRNARDREDVKQPVQITASDIGW